MANDNATSINVASTTVPSERNERSTHQNVAMEKAQVTKDQPATRATKSRRVKRDRPLTNSRQRAMTPSAGKIGRRWQNHRTNHSLWLLKRTASSESVKAAKAVPPNNIPARPTSAGTFIHGNVRSS